MKLLAIPHAFISLAHWTMLNVTLGAKFTIDMRI